MKSYSAFLFACILPSFVFASYATKCSEQNYFSFDKDSNHTIKSVKNILKKYPNDLMCVLKLINLYLKNGNVLKGFKLLVKIYNENPEFIKSHKIYKILDVAKYMVKLEKSAKNNNDAKSWDKLGAAFYKMGVFEEAAKAYKNSLSLKDQVKTRLNLAVTLSRMGQKYRALEELNHIIDQRQNNFYAYYYAGKILKYQVGDEKKGDRYLKKAYELCLKDKDKIDHKLYELYMKDLSGEIEK